MRLKDLESYLQPLTGFQSPKVELEQYVTSAHLASRMIFISHSTYDDIASKYVLDLGCGCGILSIASHLLGSKFTLGVDLDPDALEIAHKNLEASQLEKDEEDDIENDENVAQTTSVSQSVKFIQLDISDPRFDEHLKGITSSPPPQQDQGDKKFQFDTVVMNPPFGTKRKGIDMVFLESACRLARCAIYSLHKTSTRDYIRKKAKGWGFEGEVVAEMKYDLPRTLKMHKHNTLDIAVDLWRFSRINPS
ncbi:hypothetical protein CROQUDRAFT_67122 [Cronartium quercuum f. sp. fusiforme G11]|uniref:S-adenosyl-L-methionine-dependent methyltransferase n=1 Tax=Cronartium quercuum f. sp. fusiforme G11 TaxID=708437 RepID=A0A9P6NAT5_9BASI|nr:hypothetical protein CROQUDRAFT_67122 [Cronartium quercuum f. sp. fusiforme G11]